MGIQVIEGTGAASRERNDDRAPEAALVANARAGDQQAFTGLLRRHDPAMRRLAFRLLGDAHAMDDALQEAYIKAFRALPGYRQHSHFSSWLYRITYNACIDELRRSRRRPLPAIDHTEAESQVPGPEQAVIAAEVVRTALARLPVDQRVTVVLVDGEGLNHQATAEVLGIAPGTVASRLSRARATLRRSIEEVDE